MTPLDGLKRMPLVRILLPFMTGIILQDYTGIPMLLPALVSGFAFCLLVFTWFYAPLNRHYANRWVYGMVLNFFVLSFAMTLSGKRTGFRPAENPASRDGFVIARVVEPPVERERSYRVILRNLSVVTGSGLYRSAGKAAAWFEKDSLASLLNAGDIVAIPDRFTEIRNYGNPYEFDYRRYMMINGVSSRIYVPSGEWLRSGTGRRGAMNVAAGVRERLLGIMEMHGIEGSEHEIAGAILLGHRSGLDSELREAFASSGAMHILAVSGLHVGIVYIFIYWLLGNFRFTGRYQVARPALTVAVIWAYAMLTGLSPPVVRASTMFTIIAAGRSFSRSANIYNILAAAALIQLMADPDSLFRTGFQLSYLAVAGIAYYQPLFYSLIRPGNPVTDRIWALTTVSLSAQLSIFPLVLYYFNQFPNLFLLTNLMAVPLAMLILYTGFIFFIVSSVPVISSLFASVLQVMLKALGMITGMIGSLPFSTIPGIYLSKPILLIFYGIIICVTLFVACKKPGYLQLALILAVAGFGFRAVHKTETAAQQVFTVYNSGGNSLYGFISGNRNIVVSDRHGAPHYGPFINGGIVALPLEVSGAGLRLNAGEIYLCSPEEFFDASGEYLPGTLYAVRRLILFGGYRIWFPCDVTGTFPETYTPLHADLVVIGSRFTGSIEDICRAVIPGRVIIDSSIGYFARQSIISQCREAGIGYHDVSESGAFLIRASQRH